MTIQEIYSALKEKHLYPDLYEEKVGDEVMLAAHIEWGDWKHDHIYLDRVMEGLGFSLYGKYTTEEDGSDCYSATHLYRKK